MNVNDAMLKAAAQAADIGHALGAGRPIPHVGLLRRYVEVREQWNVPDIGTVEVDITGYILGSDPCIECGSVSFEVDDRFREKYLTDAEQALIRERIDDAIREEADSGEA